MTDARAARESAREYAESTRKIVRNVLHAYVYLKQARAALSAIDLARLEIPVRGDSSAVMFILTIDRVVTIVDRELQIKGACLAVAWRLLFDKRWTYIADSLHCSEERAKEIVDLATAKLLCEIVGRRITEDYRELPGLGDVAAA